MQRKGQMHTMSQHNMKKIITEKVQQRGDASFMYLEKETLQTVLQHLLQSAPSPSLEISDIIAKFDLLIDQQQQQFELLLQQLANLPEKEVDYGQ